MTPLERKIELMKAGISQAEIGRRCSVTRSQVYRVIHDLCVSDHVMRAVAAAIGKPIKDVYPGHCNREQNQKCA